MSLNALVRFAVACLAVGSLLGQLDAQSTPSNALPNTNDDASFLTNPAGAPTSSNAAAPTAPAQDLQAPVSPNDSNSLVPPPLPKGERPPPPTVSAKAPSDETVSKTEIRDISLKGPDEDSPFFTERQEAKAAMAEAGREGLGMYVPKPPHPPIQRQIGKFFQGMFGSLRPGAKKSKTEMNLMVEPADFSLAQTSELEVTLKLTNARKKEIELLYPNNQRLEILTKDPSGKVINRWSQDRAFDATEGFVAINPDEFVTYTEKLSTSGMKPSTTYTIETSLANQEGYLISTTVTPKP